MMNRLLRLVLITVMTTAFVGGVLQDGWAQEKKRRKSSPKYVVGTVDTVGKKSIILDVGKKRPIAVGVDADVTKFKAATREIKLEDLRRGDVVVVKYGKGRYEPLVYVIQTGEKTELKKGKKKKSR